MCERSLRSFGTLRWYARWKKLGPLAISEQRCASTLVSSYRLWVCLAVCLTRISGDLSSPPPPNTCFLTLTLGRLCLLTLERLHFFLPVSLWRPSDGSFKALYPGCLSFICPQVWEEWSQQFSPGVQRWPQGTPSVFSRKADAWEEIKAQGG